MRTRRLVRYAKVLAIVALALCAAASVASWVTGITPWIIVSGHVAEAQPRNKAMGALAAPLRELDFESGDWAAYILVALDDYQELRRDIPSTCLELTDREELKRIQRGLVARYTGADIVTVSSSLVFVRDGRIVFSTGIVLRGRDLDGLQTRGWGWLEPDDPRFKTGFVDRFKPVYWPFCVV